MKKILSVFLALTLCVLSAALITSASENSTVVITTDDAEYTVEFENTNLSQEQREAVAHNLVFGKDDTVQTYGLMCTLFGHNTEENMVSVITHKVKTTSPRCKREMYAVTTCSRCDYQEQEYVGTSYISCCPID